MVLLSLRLLFHMCTYVHKTHRLVCRSYNLQQKKVAGRGMSCPNLAACSLVVVWPWWLGLSFSWMKVMSVPVCQPCWWHQAVSSWVSE